MNEWIDSIIYRSKGFINCKSVLNYISHQIYFVFSHNQTLMQPPQNNKTISSLNSSRLSQSSNAVPNNLEVKRMQAKLLMDYYQQNQQLKQRKYMGENYDKANYGNYEQALTENYKSQQEAKRKRKEEIKQTLAEEYDQMIRFREQKQRQERQKTLQQEKKNLQISPWGRDSKKDVIKAKKLQSQYGKQLQMHIRLQEIQKYQQRLKQRQAIEKYQRQQEQLNLNYDMSQLNQFRRKQQFEKRQNQILGVSRVNPEGSEFGNYRSTQLNNSEIRALKRREQMLYGTGLQQQLRSQTISPKINDRHINYHDLSNRSTDKHFNPDNMFHSEVYNPITNPIQINYKNPYILRILSQHNA